MIFSTKTNLMLFRAEIVIAQTHQAVSIVAQMRSRVYLGIQVNLKSTL